MTNKDILQRFLIESAFIRGELVHLNESYQTIVQQHAYPPMIRRLLGEALVLVSLLSATIKFKGRLTLQFQGQGKLKLLIAQSDHDFHLRGLAQWDGELKEDELIADMQKGMLMIMIDPDESTQRYQGIVSWQGKSLSDSIQGYFRSSEQLLTRIWVAVNDTGASGMLLQALPREGVEPLVEGLEWEHIIHLTQTIKPEELLTLKNETILHRLYSQETVRLFESEPVTFRCTCSVKRGETAILMLGHEEAEQELKDKQIIVVKCEFCSKEFHFDRVDIETIFRNGNSSSSTQLH